MRALIQGTYKGCEYWVGDCWSSIRAGITLPEPLQKYWREIEDLPLSSGIYLILPPNNNTFGIDWEPFHWDPDGSIEELKVCCEKIINKLIELKSKDHAVKED